MPAKERLIAILGPTASGKTALAASLAKRLDTDVISGDSMLVYRGLDIGTAKPSAAERGGVRHALIDILPPDAAFSVTDFVRLAKEEITAINLRGKIPILAGGTGLYAKALIEGYQFGGEAKDEAFRREMESLAERRGREYVHSLLKAASPAAAERLHPNDLHRVIRALEVFHMGGSDVSREKSAPDYDVFAVGLCWERKTLYARIDARVDSMISAGLTREVRDLMDRGLCRASQSMQGIGYREIASFLAGDMTLDEATDAMKRATRRFAKRQLTWYRGMPYIRWFCAEGRTPDSLLEEVSLAVEGFFKIKSNL